jgi:hypothetical protein
MVEILNNPTIKAAVMSQQIKGQLGSALADQLMSTKTWNDMTKNERKICIQHVVSQVESEEELRNRLQSDFALGYVAISWHLSEPGDKTGDEARMLVTALGGLVAKNGALVMIMTADDQF